MATVFMKWLESSPKDYERGIRLITLGRIDKLRAKLVSDFVQPEQRILDLGCGTGELAIHMAQKGAHVFGVDASPKMLVEAGGKAKQHHLEEQLEFFHLDAAMIDETFQDHSFDLIACSMLFSDLPPEMQQYLLQTLRDLLAPNGKVLVIEEQPPANRGKRLIFQLIRAGITLITWLLTRQIFSQPAVDFQNKFNAAGYDTQLNTGTLLGSLVLFEASPQAEVPPPEKLIQKLTHQTGFKIWLKDLYALFFRMFPPYPKVTPGLYAVGEPDPDSPVLVTGNYDLTVRRLVKAIHEQVNCWLLVVDSGGINVWCAAGGGFLTAEKVIGAIKTSGLSRIVKHKNLILPQLAASGVSGWKIRQSTRWGVAWGPVRAEDIPEYLNNHGQKTESMRLVRFPVQNRLEMLGTALGFYALMVLLPVIIFWPAFLLQVSIAVLGLGLTYALIAPLLPGRDGLQKSLPFTILVLGGFFLYAFLGPSMDPGYQFNWAIGLIGLSVFTASELQGTSPLMRGEQANWIIEGIIGTILILLYFGISTLMGWR